MTNLAQLHEAICRDISAHINGPGRSFHVGYYETKQEVPWAAPHNGAVFLELDSFQVVDRREDGPIIVELEFAVIVVRGIGKRMACRSLALEIATLIDGNTWGTSADPATDVEGAPDRHDFQPEDYEAFRVNWKQAALFGKAGIERMVCNELYLGIEPDNETEADYIRLHPREEEDEAA